MISLGILGLLQAILLPGFALIYITLRLLKLPLSDIVLLAVPASLLTNYVVVSTLVFFGVYTQPLVIVLSSLCLVLSFGCIMHNLHQPTAKYKIITGKPRDAQYQILRSITLGVLAVFAWHTIGSVFTLWDAVVSWNRWATEWFDQNVQGSRGYPPLLPILLSLVYKCAGSTNLQTIAKIIPVVFSFWAIVCIWLAGKRLPRFQNTAYIAAFLWLFLMLSAENISFLFSGYTDPIIAAFGAFSIYAFALWHRESVKLEPQLKSRLFGVLALSLAAAALVKQTGVPLAFVSFGTLLFLDTDKTRKTLGTLLPIIAVFVFVLLHWYIFSFLKWGDFQQLDSYEQLIDSRRWIRPLLGLKMLANLMYGPLIIFLVMAVITDRSARFTLIWLIAPLFLFWALLVSYDTRSAMMFFAYIATLCAIGIVYISDRLPGRHYLGSVLAILSTYGLLDHLGNHPTHVTIEVFAASVLGVWFFIFVTGTTAHTKFRKLIKNQFVVSSVVIAILGAAFILPRFVPDHILLAENTERRLVSNDLGFNRLLTTMFNTEPDSKMLSCYQLPYNLVASAGHFIISGDCSINLALRWMNSSETKYYLHWIRTDYETEISIQNQLAEIRRHLVDLGIGYREIKWNDNMILFEKVTPNTEA